MKRAKVFISCGQRDGSDEVEIANRVSVALNNLGFDPYVAKRQQSLAGLTENIYQWLSDSEYFVFIDFKRELLLPPHLSRWKQLRQVVSGGGERRGSLFTHQELAIASFLKLQVVGFVEDGVAPREGISGFLQANFAKFSSRRDLPKLVEQAVLAKKLAREWDPESRNSINISIPEPRFANANAGRAVPTRFFQLDVLNLNKRVACRGCYCYLTAIHNMDESWRKAPQTAELKWAGSIIPGVLIPAGGSRKFDAFKVYPDDPTRLRFNVFSDSTEYVPLVEGPGRFVLSYLIVSETLGSATFNLSVSIGRTLDDISVQKAEANGLPETPAPAVAKYSMDTSSGEAFPTQLSWSQLPPEARS